ncbi:unnamed protein product [Closterium sp. NIES-54]
MTTLRLLQHVAAQRDYELHSLEFSTPFLQGSLHEEIWLRRPPSFTGSFPAADPSLFLRTDTLLPPFYVLVYVDDLVFATADTKALTLVKSELQNRHTCTDLGELRSYLGLQITRDRARRTITLTWSHLVHQVLQRFGFQFSSPQLTPLSTGHSLSAPPSDEFVEPSGPYPELVGCLITSGMGLVLGGRGPVVLTGHAVASWVDDSATQRSSLGYTFSLGSGFVSWWSTCSSLVLSSSCESEIYAGAMAAQELRWLTYLLTDLGEQPRSPPVLGATADYSAIIPPPLISPLNGAAADHSVNIPPPLISPHSGAAADYFAIIPPPLISPFICSAADYSANIPPPLLSPHICSVAISSPPLLWRPFSSFPLSLCTAAFLIQIHLFRLPLLPLPFALAALSPPCTASPICCSTPLPVSFQLSHHRRQPSAPTLPATAPPGAGLLPSVFSVTLPSHASILGASPLMDPRFAVPFPPFVDGDVSPHSFPTVAALSLPPTLDFVLDSGATDSVFVMLVFFALFPLWTGRQPSARPLRVWGCVAHVLVNPADRARQGGKLAPKTQLCAFIGINTDCPGYFFYAPSSQQLLRSQDVIFDETRSPFLIPPPTPPPPSLHWSDFDPHPSATTSPSPLPPASAPPLLPAPSAPPSAITSSTSPPASSSSAPIPSPSSPPAVSLPSFPFPPPSPRINRSMAHAMSNFQHSALFTRLSSSQDPVEDRFEELFSVHPVSPLLCVTIGNFCDFPTLLSVDTAAIPTPHTYSEAVSGFHATEWMASIIAECEAFTHTDSYIDSVPPLGATIVKGKWVFPVKQLPGELPVFKARYCAKGFTQREGIEYFATFSLTARLPTLRLLLDLGARWDWEIHSMGVSNAFLQGELHEHIFLERPAGFPRPFLPGTIWEPKRPIYGLKQAPRKWHAKLASTLHSLGFSTSSFDPSIFIHTSPH